MKNQSRNTLLAAAFLMATSAIGPGFLTQTALFTNQLLANFGSVILATILLDLVAQLNIWQIIVVSQKRAQDIANELVPGLGYLLALLILFGGLAFNIGNIGGAGLGLEIVVGCDPKTGAIWSGLIAITLFVFRKASTAMDRLVKLLGLVMIGLTGYVAWKSAPPLKETLQKTILPERIDLYTILTLVGGTVGGYISFAGAHRLVDAGIKGAAHRRETNKSAITAIGLASLMRILLFLAALGVVTHYGALDLHNPAAAVFKMAAGTSGYKLFGIVLWCASLTSVIGAAYTSISFIRGFHPKLERYGQIMTIFFIVLSTGIFVTIGKPVQLLVLAGALNGLILPLALLLMLIAAYQVKIMGDHYRHPLWLTLSGITVVLLMIYVGFRSF